jgi:hypothetical protein
VHLKTSKRFIVKLLGTIILAAAAFMAAPAFSKTDCNVHKIYCKIVKLQPWIDKDFAMEVSDMIHKGAKKYGLDPMVSVAILNQESSFRNINTFHIEKTITQSCNESKCVKKVIEEHEVVDMGIAQINITTALHFDLDIERLFKLDTAYAIESHFIILSSKVRTCDHLGEEAWSCYHSVTPKHRLKYVKDVSRFM